MEVRTKKCKISAQYTQKFLCEVKIYSEIGSKWPLHVYHSNSTTFQLGLSGRVSHQHSSSAPLLCCLDKIVVVCIFCGM